MHIADGSGVLKDCDFDSEYNSKNSPYGKNFSKKKSKDEKKEERLEALETAFSGVQEDGVAAIKDLAEYLEMSEKTVRRYLKEHGNFWIDGGETGVKDRDKIE